LTGDGQGTGYRQAAKRPIGIIEDSLVAHKFRPGEHVTLQQRNVPHGVYEVKKQLPHNGSEFEYRVKAASEEHERVARESELAKS
jgi:hypothetical protein